MKNKIINRLSTKIVDNYIIYPHFERVCLKIIAETAKIINKKLKNYKNIIHRWITKENRFLYNVFHNVFRFHLIADDITADIIMWYCDAQNGEAASYISYSIKNMKKFKEKNEYKDLTTLF